MARARSSVPREARVAYGEVAKSLDRLAKSIAEIRTGLRRTERRIELDARVRIRALRAEARKQLSVLESRRRDTARTLRRLSVAAGGSWRDIKRAADTSLAEARTAAAAVVRHFRRALR